MPFIRPIETVYQGYRFRSRLEARWAVYFDVLGARWEYEKEGFDVNGTWYLPDFYLMDLGCFVEVKPIAFTREEVVLATACDCLMLDGMPENTFYFYPGHPFCEVCSIDPYACYSTGTVYGRVHLAESLRRKRLWFSFGESIDAYDNTRNSAAVAASRAARFEHGEKGIRL